MAREISAVIHCLKTAALKECFRIFRDFSWKSNLVYTSSAYYKISIGCLKRKKELFEVLLSVKPRKLTITFPCVFHGCLKTVRGNIPVLKGRYFTVVEDTLLTNRAQSSFAK
ncbi:hypothetical protein NPIL_112581 [Nephila pilipes]|uniref:Uncharacterized protein n=1 Tax=Nephila pilipes TaxID=299642 RepID=A0A8X6T8L8_NEPPI|nr:hypothetical protein NPIL_112581 [Nephila pilipes]